MAFQTGNAKIEIRIVILIPVKGVQGNIIVVPLAARPPKTTT
jgi:hypothetical protein